MIAVSDGSNVFVFYHSIFSFNEFAIEPFRVQNVMNYLFYIFMEHYLEQNYE